MAPRLSICIPTHDGRAGPLERAIDSVLDQIGPDLAGEVEVCVSDNGSQDATRAMVADRVRARPGVVSYHRFDENRGFTANLLQAVGESTGEFCWLFSSDDALAPGGLHRLLDILARNPDVTGVSIAPLSYDFEHETEAWPFYADVQPPHPEREHHWSTVHDTIVGCGAMMGLLPAQVVRRATWDTAVEEIGCTGLARFPRFPHLVILYRAVLTRPAWVWDPGPTFVLRTEVANSVVDALGGDFTRYHLETTGETIAIWRELFGDGPIMRELLRKTRRAFFTPRPVMTYKAQPGQRISGDIQLASACARWFWRVPGFWATLPVLLVPHPVARLLARGFIAVRRLRSALAEA